MPVSPFSRYRNLIPLEVRHADRGATRSLPIRRLPMPMAASGRPHRFSGFDTVDLLAHRYFGREALYWYLLDANGGRMPSELEVGEFLSIPPLELATRVQRPGP